MTDKKFQEDIAQKRKQFREYTEKFKEDVEKLKLRLRHKSIEKKELEKKPKKAKKR